jgi:hypothetical protein
MRGVATVVLLLSLGCAGDQQAQQPGGAPPAPRFVAEGTSESFFTSRRGDEMLPVSAGEDPAGPAR